MQLTAEPQQRAELALDLSVAYLVAGRFGRGDRHPRAGCPAGGENDQELRWHLEAHLISFAGIDPAHAELAKRHLDRVPHGLEGETAESGRSSPNSRSRP